MSRTKRETEQKEERRNQQEKRGDRRLKLGAAALLPSLGSLSFRSLCSRFESSEVYGIQVRLNSGTLLAPTHEHVERAEQTWRLLPC
jgi:hypothetical protein